MLVKIFWDPFKKDTQPKKTEQTAQQAAQPTPAPPPPPKLEALAMSTPATSKAEEKPKEKGGWKKFGHQLWFEKISEAWMPWTGYAGVILAITLFIMMMYALGWQRLGTVLMIAAGLAAVWLLIQIIKGSDWTRSSSHSQSLTETNQEREFDGDVVKVVKISPEQPMQMVHLDDWSRITEWPEEGKIAYSYMPLGGKPTYDTARNLQMDMSRVVTLELGKQTRTLHSPSENSGVCVYFADPGVTTTVTLVKRRR